MTAYSPDWLDLRAHADSVARSDTLTARLVQFIDGPSRIVDLGAGSGANTRYLAPRLPGPQHWRLIDHDDALLARARRQCRGLAGADGQAVRVTTSTQDLAEVEDIDLEGADLVTGSALLDLVGERWLSGLVKRSVHADCAALFVLSYDGRIDWRPMDATDASLRAAFNAHQRAQCHCAEPALGSFAAACAIDGFTRAGFRVDSAASDWQLAGDQPDLLRALVDGWVAAASEQEPAFARRFSRWGEIRAEQIAAESLSVRVGHRDFLALPGPPS